MEHMAKPPMSIPTPLLDGISSPKDLKKLPKEKLPDLVKEIRECFLDNISVTGGHFASNLGAIDLTVALHYVYDTPFDHLVWDVGHQAYAHKILTGRRDRMSTIRQTGGLAPFPKMSESEYDAFGVGHSSTSIGAALGMALADRLQGIPSSTVAVIGDGAMTAGQAFEALNNLGPAKDLPLLVIFNDNNMSISPNVGAIHEYFVHNAMELATHIKEQSKEMLKNIPIPGAYDVAKDIKNTLKDFVDHGHFKDAFPFANFGIEYEGPVNGHDVIGLVNILREIRSGPRRPVLLHVMTQKGHGYIPAEKDPVGFHAIGAFDRKKPPLAAQKGKSSVLTYTEVFSRWINAKAAKDKRLVGITPAMREGSGLVEFEKNFPKRYFDVGIAEQHAVTFAGGLATRGMKPVVAIYSTFLQRAYDQFIHDVAIQNLPVMFAIDRAGIVGADGPTHVGAYDLSYMGCIPNMTIAVPSDERECFDLLNTCYELDSPSAVRYPRGKGIGVPIDDEPRLLPVGKAKRELAGNKVAILAFGALIKEVRELAKNRGWSLWDMRFLKPLDMEAIKEAAEGHEAIVTIEENAIIGGAGSQVLQALQSINATLPVKNLGIPDIVTEHGSPDDVLRMLGLKSEEIEKTLDAWLDGIGVKG